MKINYSIHLNNNQNISKTDYFDDDDTFSDLFSKAKEILEDGFNEKESIFTVNKKIVDENMPISQLFPDKSKSGTIKLNVEKIIKISILADGQYYDLNVYENIKISDSPQFLEIFEDKIGSFKLRNLHKKDKEIDIYKTPKELGIETNSSFEAISNDDYENKTFTNNFFDSSFNSQSFDRKGDSQQETPVEISVDLSDKNPDSNNISNAGNASHSNSISSESPSNRSALSSFSAMLKKGPEVSELPTNVNCNTNLNDFFSSSKPSILVPETYKANIVISDSTGDDLDIEIQSSDAKKFKDDLLSITASDVIDAYCEKNGIEKEGLILFSSKWERIDSDSLIWKHFIKKRKIRKNEKDHEKVKETKEDNNKLAKYIESHSPLRAELYIRQNKQLMNHFDVLVTCKPFNLKEDQLLEYFKRYGEITNVLIFKSKNGQSRGIARITFKREADANAAVDNTKTLRYTQEKNEPFLHVFRPNLQYATSSKKEIKSIFVERK